MRSARLEHLSGRALLRYRAADRKDGAGDDVRVVSPQVPDKLSSQINRLPPEVFATVLAHRWPGRDLISATHVCRYWRTALLSFALLWAEIHCVGEEQTFFFLERAKAAPLRIYLRPRFSHTALRTFIAPHVDRIELLVAHPMITIDTTALCRDLSSPAPKLKTLVIAPRSASWLYLPTIFKGDLPELRRFTIERATFDLTVSDPKPNPPQSPVYGTRRTSNGRPAGFPRPGPALGEPGDGSCRATL